MARTGPNGGPSRARERRTGRGLGSEVVGVMESAKPPTKLAQAWAAWNESTKAADDAAADQASKEQAEAESFTLTPPSAGSAAPASGEQTTSSSTATTGDAGAGSVAVGAAGTWKPPVQDGVQSLAGGAMSWLRRDRERDHGGH